MGTVRIFVVVLLLVSACFGQVLNTFGALGSNNVWTGTDQFNQGIITQSITNQAGNYIPLLSSNTAAPAHTLIWDASQGFIQIQADSGAGANLGGQLSLQSTNGPNGTAVASLLVGSSGMQINAAGATIFAGGGLKTILTGPGTLQIGDVGGTAGNLTFVGNAGGSQTFGCNSSTCTTLLVSNLALSNVTGVIAQCLSADTNGLITGNGQACGAGGGVSGSGTANTIPLWTSSSALGNSILSQSGTVLSFVGTLKIGTGTGFENLQGAANGSKFLLYTSGSTGGNGSLQYVWDSTGTLNSSAPNYLAMYEGTSSGPGFAGMKFTTGGDSLGSGTASGFIFQPGNSTLNASPGASNFFYGGNSVGATDTTSPGGSLNFITGTYTGTGNNAGGDFVISLGTGHGSGRNGDISINGSLGFNGTKTSGSCVFTIVAGIVTNVTGC